MKKEITPSDTGNVYVRRGITLSPFVDETASRESKRLFSGNYSAFVAHAILFYVHGQKCQSDDKVSVDIDNVNTTQSGAGNSQTVVNSRS